MERRISHSPRTLLVNLSCKPPTSPLPRKTTQNSRKKIFLISLRSSAGRKRSIKIESKKIVVVVTLLRHQQCFPPVFGLQLVIKQLSPRSTHSTAISTTKDATAATDSSSASISVSSKLFRKHVILILLRMESAATAI